MKPYLLFIFWIAFTSINAQVIDKILPPDGFGLDNQEMRAHYLDETTNTLFCSTKRYNDTEGRYENHIVLYNTLNETMQLINTFFATSNVDWTNYSNFTRYNNLLFFRFGKKVFKYNFDTQIFEILLDVTNLDGYDIVGDILTYYTPGIAHFMDLNTEQVINTFDAAYLDGFHKEGDNIYFYRSDYGFSSTKHYQIVKYNVVSNSFSTIFSNSFTSTIFAVIRKTDFVKVNNQLIYTIQTSSNTGSYISINLTDGSINTDFTFNVTTQYQLPEPFKINNQVFITTVDETYVSNGINQPTLTTLGKLIGAPLINHSNDLLYNNEMYRTVNRDNLGSELWKTDGNTVSLVKDVISGEVGGMAPFTSGIIKNNKIYFGSGQRVIYESDGTESGTLPLFSEDLFSFINVPLIHDTTDKLYFFGESSTLGNGLFKISTQTLSTEEFNNDKLKLYPNPSSNFVYFNKPIHVIKIYDQQGKLVLQKENTEEIDISILSKNAIYLVELHSNGTISYEKLVKTE